MTIQQNRNPDPDPSHRTVPANSAPLLLDRAGDALALVRHTFGELPSDSLVLIGLHRGTTGGHLRMDLAPALQQPRRCAEKAAAWLAGPEADPAPEAVLAAVFTDTAPQAQQRHGEAVMNELSEILQLQYQCPLVRTWYAGAGFVRDFDCTDSRCCPYPGLPVDDELAAALARSPQLEKLVRPTAPEQAIETFLGVPLSPSAACPHEVADLRDSVPEHHQPHQGIDAALALWEQSIAEITATGHCASVQHPAHTAQLLNSAEDSLLVQSLAPLAAVGIDAARPQQADSPEDQYLTAFTGQTGCAPQWARVEALDSLLHLLAPYAGPQRQNLLALKGWVEWAKGCGSNAALAVSCCLEEEPNHQLAGLLAELFDVSGPCHWARVKQFSHGWWQSRQPV